MAKTPPCQYPKAARKAALILFGPAYPIEIKIDPALKPLEYGNPAPFVITSSSPQIPAKVMIDLQTNISHSLLEEFDRISNDAFLAKHCPHLQEDIAGMGTAFKTIIKAGIDNTHVPPDVMRLLREREIAILHKAKQELANTQTQPGFSRSVQLTPEKLGHIFSQGADVANTMLRESSKEPGK